MKQYSSDDVQCGQVLRDFLLSGYHDVRFGNYFLSSFSEPSTVLSETNDNQTSTHTRVHTLPVVRIRSPLFSLASVLPLHKCLFALNSMGTRFGCLHPLTSLRLYRSLCLPIMLYGSELWFLTKTELMFLERVHRKILRSLDSFVAKV